MSLAELDVIFGSRYFIKFLSWDREIFIFSGSSSTVNITEAKAILIKISYISHQEFKST